jgi:hypothetical protein
MKKIFGFYFLLLLISGCVTGSIDYSTVEIINESGLSVIKSWRMQYDTLNGRILTNDFIGGSTETKYIDTRSNEELLDEPYVVAELRGQKLAENIRYNMSSKISGDGNGIIKVSRPVFKDKYIMHVRIAFFDSGNLKLADIDVFNKCDYDGRFTIISPDAMHDDGFAKYCSDKIYQIIGK